MTKIKVTVEISYKGDAPDHSHILDVFQDADGLIEDCAPEHETIEA